MPIYKKPGPSSAGRPRRMGQGPSAGKPRKPVPTGRTKPRPKLPAARVGGGSGNPTKPYMTNTTTRKSR